VDSRCNRDCFADHRPSSLPFWIFHRTFPPLIGGRENETHLPTQHPATCPSTRVPSSDVQQGWAIHHPSASSQGPTSAERLIESCNQRTDFAELQRANRFSGQLFWMMFSPDATLEFPRVAYAIGRGYGNAVRRNRIRRQTRAILRQNATDLPRGRYLIGTMRSTHQPTFTELEADMTALISKLDRSR